MAKRKQSKQSVRARAPRQSSAWPWHVGFALALAGIAASGIAVVSGAHDMRILYQQLGEVQRAQDALLASHSRLMLERSARSSLQSIEDTAREELGMEFPIAGQVVVE